MIGELQNALHIDPAMKQIIHRFLRGRKKLIAQRRIMGAQKLQILFIRKGRTLHEQVDNIHDNSSTSLYSVTTVYLTFLLYYIARLVTRWV